ncbi:hypothetical protein [Stieleria varia]|uniref:hypothetical protein n=1 Tax=Stieleria varia TaxID=2528005 RepID=UPI0011B415E4|nr:hypothetical protein [Stieleria varia]
MRKVAARIVDLHDDATRLQLEHSNEQTDEIMRFDRYEIRKRLGERRSRKVEAAKALASRSPT